MHFAHRLDEIEALRVGNDFRSVERIVHLLDELFLVHLDCRIGSVENRCRSETLVFLGGKNAGFDSGIDRGNHDGIGGAVHHGPASRSLLTGLVDDQIDEVLSSPRIFLFENLARDLNEERLERSLVPLRENLRHLIVGNAGALENLVGFADQLHVAVLDAVVDHLHIVAGTAGSDVSDTGNAVDLGTDGFEDRLNDLPRAGRTTGHDGRSLAGSLFSAGNAGPDEEQALFAEILGTTLGVDEVGVSPVDDEISFVEQWDKAFDDLVNRIAIIGVSAGGRLHKNHDLAGTFEAVDEVFERFGAVEILVGVFVDEILHRLRGPVVDRNAETAALDI